MKNLFLTFLLGFYSSCSQMTPDKNIVLLSTDQKNINNKHLEKNFEDTIKKDISINIPEKNSNSIPLPISNTDQVIKYCKKIDQAFEKYKWGESHCNDFSWNHVRNSYLGNPIIWHTIGEEAENSSSEPNTTLILCGVHGDEITPVKFCFDILQDLKNNPKIIKNKLVIIAPIVTPDSFFKKYPTRTNARGVDVNRNFPTDDWRKSAKKIWKTRYRSDKRRFPGHKALSEQETIFQVNLIKRYNPNKIISVHAPLTLIDYDGPEDTQKNGQKGKELLIQMSHKAGKYRINNYPFFPGSLGNWAGNERNIPTYTLELPNSDWTKTKTFYATFRAAIHHAIDHELTPNLPNKKLSDIENDTEHDSNDSESVL